MGSHCLEQPPGPERDPSRAAENATVGTANSPSAWIDARERSQHYPMPSVSVIMPCFNHGAYVRDSMHSILAQTMSDLELLVVDDFSTDTSRERVMEVMKLDSRVRLLCHPKNLGVSKSRNDGIAAAKGKYLAFCDADDLWLPEKLARQLPALEAQSHYGLAYCESEIIDQNGVWTGRKFSDDHPAPRPSGNTFNDLCRTNFINTQTVIVRRDLLPADLRFDEKIRRTEDWWLWLQLARKTAFVYDPTVLAQYRVHPTSTRATQANGYHRDNWKVCKKNLRLHRDMPLPEQGLMWYSMGYGLCALGKRRWGRAFMAHALLCAVRGRAQGCSSLEGLQM